MRYTATILCLLALWSGRVDAQQPAEAPGSYKIVPVNGRSSRDTAGGAGIIAFPVRANCKAVKTCLFLMTQEAVRLKTLRGNRAHPRKQPLITVHGNILYDFDYWSHLDTPYAERNINQQMLQTYIDLTYKNEYPFRVVFTNPLE